MNGVKIERDFVDELKKRMKDLMEPEMYEDESLFYRFLKARDFNIDKAETMLKNHLRWRKEYDLKNFHKTTPPEVLPKYFPYILLGYDKEGFPVRYCPLGNIDYLGLLNSAKEEDIKKGMFCVNEEDARLCKDMSKKLGKTVDKTVQIFDLNNLSLAKATDKRIIFTAISLFDIYQNNYPETLKSCYVINASMYFSLIYAIAKRFVPSTILNKVKIYYSDTYKEDLLQVIDADVLPAFLGGNRTDPDGNVMCNTFINYGGPVPESYYIHKVKRPLSSASGVQKVTLNHAAFHEIVLEVKEPGSHLEWEFETKSRDIGFGLFYQRVSSDGELSNKELIPISRINTEECAETGLCLCEKAGTYVIVFDNTYSWIRSKELFYRIKIVKPAEQESDV